jgi:hypothetical protein
MDFIRTSREEMTDLQNILSHPGDFKQTIETTFNLCISPTISNKKQTINETNGDISQKNIALWVYKKMYPTNDETISQDPYADDDKENVNPNTGKNKNNNQTPIQKTPKYTLVDLNTLFEIESQSVLRKFSNDIEKQIDIFIKQVLKAEPEELTEHIKKVITLSIHYIKEYPHFTFFIKKLFYDRLVNWMDRLTVIKQKCNMRDCNKIIDYWNSLISEFIHDNLQEYTNLQIDPINPKTPYSIMGGRVRKLKNTKKKSLRKRKQSRKR